VHLQARATAIWAVVLFAATLAANKWL